MAHYDGFSDKQMSADAFNQPTPGGREMTRAQICDRAVLLSSVCHGENADRALNEWLDVDAAQRQEIGDLRNDQKARIDADARYRKAVDETVAQHAKVIEQLQGLVTALEGALKAVRPALREASNDYNHPRFTDRHGTGFRIDVALKVIEAALAATGEEGT
jgi:hypothetical protein